MSRMPRKKSPRTPPQNQSENQPQDHRTTKANPEEFGKQTTPVRERMTKAMRETTPEDRLRSGR